MTFKTLSLAHKIHGIAVGILVLMVLVAVHSIR